MSRRYRFDSLSLGERAGERVAALQGGFVREDPLPNPLPRGEGACRSGHFLLTEQ